MRQNEQVVQRSRGRPQLRPDEETRRLVIEAAREEFLSNGYAGASCVAVAQRAGVSTKTMYRLVPTKADLFRSFLSERISRFVLDIDAAALDTLPVDEALERILVAYGSLALNGETIAIYRLVLGECDRFPEIAATFTEVAIGGPRKAMAASLKRLCDRGLLVLEDASAATDMLRGMMIMEPQRAVMLRERAAPDAAEIASRAKHCARLFLNGCRRRKSAS